MNLRIRRHLVLATLVALGVGVTAWWLETGRHRFHPKGLGTLDGGRILRSGQVHRRLVPELVRGHGVDLVIDLSKDEPHEIDAHAERTWLDHAAIPQVHFEDLSGDGTGPIESYVDALARMLEARQHGKTVWVHCSGGSERTGALVAWYRMLFEDWSGQRAYEEYVSFRMRPPKNDIHKAFVNEHTEALIRGLEARGIRPPFSARPFGPAASAPERVPTDGS